MSTRSVTAGRRSVFRMQGPQVEYVPHFADGDALLPVVAAVLPPDAPGVGEGRPERARVLPLRAHDSGVNGIERSRLPVSAKTAFAIAGGVTGTISSPTPVGFSVLGTMCVSITGHSLMRTTG